MAATDPRVTIKAIVDAVLLAPGVIVDDNGVAVTGLSLWEGGPEGLLYIFYTLNHAFLLTFGEPRSREKRRVEDIPLHYLMSYPVTVTTMNKPNVTAARMQYKVTYALRACIEAAARSAVGGPVAYRIHIITDDAKHKRIGYSDIWEANHIVEYETGYP